MAGKWSVIAVDVFDDEIYEVKCLKVCASAEECATFISNEKERFQQSRKKRFDYIRNFVQSIKVPERASRSDWKKFVSKFYPKGDHSHINSASFRAYLEHNLLGCMQLPNFPTYQPPEYLFPLSMHIVQLPDE